MKALLLLGGLGRRLRPFTVTTPKPLLTIANIPLVEYQFALLKKYGIVDVILGLGYKGRDFKELTAIGKKMGMKATLSFEKKPLGTGGGIRNACKFLSAGGKKEPFLVFNGDVLADFNLEKLITYHREKSSDVTMGLVKVADPSPYGLVLAGEGMRVEKFIEKPSRQDVVSDTVNAGVYIFNSPDMLKDIPENEEISVEREVFPRFLKEGRSMFGYVHYGYWLDVGTVESFKKANFDVLEGRFNPDYRQKEDSGVDGKIINEGKISMGKNSFIGEDTVIKGNVIIGDNCFVGRESLLQDTVILSSSAVKNNCTVLNSVLGKEVYIGEYSSVKDSVFPDKSLLRPYSKMG